MKLKENTKEINLTNIKQKGKQPTRCFPFLLNNILHELYYLLELLLEEPPELLPDEELPELLELELLPEELPE